VPAIPWATLTCRSTVTEQSLFCLLVFSFISLDFNPDYYGALNNTCE
jgi:hypothetical protein